MCLGYGSKKVISRVTVTKREVSASQCHERFGTEKLYENLKQIPGVTVFQHCHDQNLSVSKYVREQTVFPDVIDQWDEWHGKKGFLKGIQSLSSGTLKTMYDKWSPKLADKPAALKTHAKFAIDNCEANPEKQKESLLIPLKHYQDDHSDCFPTARCKTDPKYEPRRKLLDENAVSLLETGITKCNLYKRSEKFVHGMDTFHLESFFNTLNLYRDKRIYFSSSQYRMRTLLAIIYWNENVGRDKYSMWQREDIEGNSVGIAKKCLKPPSYKFAEQIWTSLMNLFSE